MKKSFAIFFSAVFLLASCSKQDSKKVKTAKANLESGTWRAVLDLGEEELPFNFILLEKDGKYEMAVINAKEKITVNQITRFGDSLHIKMPVFDSEFQLNIVDSTKLEGVWVNNYFSSDYRIPFTATFDKKYRFSRNVDPVHYNISGKYEVTFGDVSDKTTKAVGLFEQGKKNPTYLTGTFLTETGDYRHLEGEFVGDSLYLSGFDGAHAYLFQAAFENGELKGEFYSGTHYKQEWTAVKNPIFELRDPYSLTFLKEGYEQIDFTFPNLEGEKISLSDKRYQNKVVILQIMGSWCPNCMDETVYLTELYEQYKEQGLEVVALAFERTNDKEKAIKLLKSLKMRFGARYEFLLASYEKKASPDTLLPMLDHFISFPTSIFIDKKGNVRKIHAGFYGPGTGDYYLRFKEETDALVQKLLAE